MPNFYNHHNCKLLILFILILVNKLPATLLTIDFPLMLKQEDLFKKLIAVVCAVIGKVS